MCYSVFSQDFIKSELKPFDLELIPKQNGREGVDFLIGENQLYLQSIDLDTSQRSIKVSKQDLGELKDVIYKCNSRVKQIFIR